MDVRKIFIICFQDGDFFAKDSFSRLVFFFSNMLHDGFRHADGFSFSFVLIQKKRKRKEKIKATSPGLLRKGRSGAEKWTRSVALRSDSIFQRRPSIPTLTPLQLGQSFFHAKALRCWLWGLCLLAFGFYYLVLYTFTFTLRSTYQYRIDNSVFSHGILYT